ncbi:nuclear pore complex protein Nup50 isoform X2 [Ischnura elegans]|nr:nuclear pore complex protein Nup50 isoform X2 [Ischnura elegans]XP_046395642.1 nuclear pore complex protein Nup50 isoform X2 [Ischnura elegans]XP_046395643.1 nuclear pore complex protein Nup50 isoform X2 [Ischnura elegans]
MAKRGATTELNHDNWNEEEEPEEPGTFQKASADELKKRVIKTARRRNPGLGNGSTKSAFAGFGGFASTASAPKTANFTFGPGSNSSSSSSNGTQVDGSTAVKVTQSTPTTMSSSVPSSSGASEGTSTENSHSREYYAQLKGLNESVSAWIKSHVDKNPICILTPIFRDYERHLLNIENAESQRKKDNTSESSSKDVDTTEKTEKSSSDNTFSFTLGPRPAVTNLTTTSAVSTTSSSPFFGSPSSAQGSGTAFIGSGFTFGKKSEDTKDMSIKNEVNPFLSGSKETFNFGQAQSAVGGASTSFPSAGFTFGGNSTFSFLNPAKSEAKAEEEKSGEKEEDEEDTPKDEFKPIVEDDAIYTKRCKLFVKKEGKFNECGVGTLHIKPVSEDEEQKKKKIQVVVRADNAIGTVLLNVLYGGSSSLPTPTRVGKNNVMLVCPLPSEPDNKPLPVLVRVKDGSDADELLKHLTDLDN